MFCIEILVLFNIAFLITKKFHSEDTGGKWGYDTHSQAFSIDIKDFHMAWN